jgi:hypothetical protein
MKEIEGFIIPQPTFFDIFLFEDLRLFLVLVEVEEEGVAVVVVVVVLLLVEAAEEVEVVLQSIVVEQEVEQN